MKFSIIIPTMWKAPEMLLLMLHQYILSTLVGEILIIDNIGLDRNEFPINGKVRILNNGNNLFVNPSWNLGVQEAKEKLIILANDDIFIQDIHSTLTFIYEWLCYGMLIGFSKNCFDKKRTEPLAKEKTLNHINKQEYGFGVFMSLYKHTYITIPEQLKVWYGDSFLFNKLSTFIINGVNVETKMRTTSRILNLQDQYKIETEYYKTLEL